MDPSACLAELILAAIDGDRFDMNDRIRDLCGWLDNGGAAPNPEEVIDRVYRARPQD